MISTAAIFGQGMILRRNSRVKIWGNTDREHIEVSFAGTTYIPEKKGSEWNTIITCGESREPQTMIISAWDDDLTEAKETLIYDDILLGEVWLAGGQSNMEFELQNSDDSEKIMSEADFDKIRFYNVPKKADIDDELLELEKSTRWVKTVGRQCAQMSAVAYHFAVKLYNELDVPIGIIGCNMGGTSATCWVDEEALSNIPEVKDYLDEWDYACNVKTDEEYEREMADYNAIADKWNETVEALPPLDPDKKWDIINDIAGQYPWPQPKGRTSMFRPFGLYEAMICRIAPYGISGVIFYQGEEDSSRAAYYDKLNTALIKKWRESFATDDCDAKTVPFILTQLPMYLEAGKADDKEWCLVREAQLKCQENNENVGIAIINDCGEYGNVHPTDKLTVGERLALVALDLKYDSDKGVKNCKVTEVSFDGNECLLKIDNIYDGLCYKESDGRKLTAKGKLLEIGRGVTKGICGFEVLGKEGTYYTPQIQVDGNRIILTGIEADDLIEVRYSWFNYGVANVYSSAGVPLMPFRYMRSV